MQSKHTSHLAHSQVCHARCSLGFWAAQAWIISRRSTGPWLTSFPQSLHLPNISPVSTCPIFHPSNQHYSTFYFDFYIVYPSNRDKLTEERDLGYLSLQFPELWTEPGSQEVPVTMCSTVFQRGRRHFHSSNSPRVPFSYYFLRLAHAAIFIEHPPIERQLLRHYKDCECIIISPLGRPEKRKCKQYSNICCLQ